MNSNRTIAVATGEPRISADRKAAVWIGVLYIIGTVALVLSVVVTDAVLTGPAFLAQIAAQPNQLAIGGGCQTLLIRRLTDDELPPSQLLLRGPLQVRSSRPPPRRSQS